MLAFNRYFLLLIVALSPLLAEGQICSITLKGVVTDEHTGEPLEAVNVFVQENNTGAVTDHDGQFELDNYCNGSYHIVFSHIGCESQQIFIQLQSDTLISMTLDHSVHVLDDVVLSAKEKERTTQEVELITAQEIADQGNDNLSNLLESIAGVSTVRNGNSIAKPIVHGLYGNRLTILNNGISQSGQQWGNDHAPEIDPLIANKIKVVKGTSSLEYFGSNLGSVILVEPQKILREPHLHGRVSYFYESNGRGHSSNLQLQKYAPALGWKVNATFKKSGDKKTPDYYLNNTGLQEANIAVQLEKSFNDNWYTDLYFSSFNTELGVLRGSHIGNLTDLESAFVRDVPFFTEDEFSYDVESPKQRVGHHLLKLHSKYYFTEGNILDVTLASQLNGRKEFDIRRSGRSDIAALSLRQITAFAEGKYESRINDSWKVKTGIQFNLTDNTNVSGTGILPLIPDYRALETGLFAFVNKETNNSFFEIGLRYDNIFRNVRPISQSIPREVLNFDDSFDNLNGSLGWRWNLDDDFLFSFNMGYAKRAPAINELYSAGLHQGVSGIEEGNVKLNSEEAIKTTFGFKVNLDNNLILESLVYYQRIDDYIYLNPADDFRVTIRGAFPVFTYEQTNADIYGFDLTGRLELSKSVFADLSYSYIQGRDLVNNIALINIPSNDIEGTLSYEFLNAISIGNKQLENMKIEVSSRYVFRQADITTEQDFVLPPDAYHLLGINMSTDIQLPKTRLRFTAKIDNLLNEVYRDYLNRQRYFSDDLGMNAVIGVSLKF